MYVPGRHQSCQIYYRAITFVLLFYFPLMNRSVAICKIGRHTLASFFVSNLIKLSPRHGQQLVPTCTIQQGAHGAVQQKETNNQFGRTVKHVWNVAVQVLHNFFAFLMYTMGPGGRSPWFEPSHQQNFNLNIFSVNYCGCNSNDR